MVAHADIVLQTRSLAAAQKYRALVLPSVEMTDRSEVVESQAERTIGKVCRNVLGKVIWYPCWSSAAIIVESWRSGNLQIENRKHASAGSRCPMRAAAKG